MMERPLWQRILYNIWPTIHRIINNTLFFVIRFIKTLIKLIIQQIRQI